MPDFAAWSDPTHARALDAQDRIADQPIQIVIRRGTDLLPPQTVRIEFATSAREDLDVRRGLNVVPGVQRAIVFGILNHPTAPNTDIQRGDRFILAATEFEVIAIILTPGELQAICEART